MDAILITTMFDLYRPKLEKNLQALRAMNQLDTVQKAEALQIKLLAQIKNPSEVEVSCLYYVHNII